MPIEEPDPLGRVFVPLGELVPTETEIEAARQKATATDGPKRHRRRIAYGIGLLASLGLLAATPAGSAINDLASKFSSAFSGDEQSGNQVVSEETIPPWLTDESASKEQILTTTDGHTLTLAPEGGDDFIFNLDGKIGIGESRAAWMERLSSNFVELLGPVPSQGGQVAVFGLSARDVARVKITYGSGPPATTKPENGGFIVLLDRDRGEPESLEGVAEDGSVIQTRSLPPLLK